MIQYFNGQIILFTHPKHILIIFLTDLKMQKQPGLVVNTLQNAEATKEDTSTTHFHLAILLALDICSHSCKYRES